ncbi:hypothetical protein PVAP13_9KG169704 [Panicum virgatum]|uniref:Uncharacterized protein n=1 Tax=Panicum virgatum TaxID=38727 RepID=A0A8T0NNT8_PANVG|nr:hypothetical protein PVAP13_9KG169704 [Panicum virgatum]
MDNIFNGSSDLPVESEELFGKDQCAFGYSAAMGSLDVPPNTQVNMVGSSQMSCPPPMIGQPSQGVVHYQQQPLLSRLSIIEIT